MVCHGVSLRVLHPSTASAAKELELRYILEADGQVELGATLNEPRRQIGRASRCPMSRRRSCHVYWKSN
jgi:hypothetical protein